MRLIQRSGWKSNAPNSVEGRAKKRNGPWAVKCRCCGAQIGEPCHTKKGTTARSHTIRRREARNKRMT